MISRGKAAQSEGWQHKLMTCFAVDQDSGCWLWFGRENNLGYGQIGFNGKTKYAHRLMYELHHGQIPSSLNVLHKCDMPSCINPSHLFLGTQADNLRDAANKGRMSHGRGRYNAKLTDHNARAIRADERTNKHIAEHYGVDPSLISRIKAGQRWRHVT